MPESFVICRNLPDRTPIHENALLPTGPDRWHDPDRTSLRTPVLSPRLHLLQGEFRLGSRTSRAPSPTNVHQQLPWPCLLHRRRGRRGLQGKVYSLGPEEAASLRRRRRREPPRGTAARRVQARSQGTRFRRAGEEEEEEAQEEEVDVDAAPRRAMVVSQGTSCGRHKITNVKLNLPASSFFPVQEDSRSVQHHEDLRRVRARASRRIVQRGTAGA